MLDVLLVTLPGTKEARKWWGLVGVCRQECERRKKVETVDCKHIELLPDTPLALVALFCFSSDGGRF